jgi:ankyrin repeat protein
MSDKQALRPLPPPSVAAARGDIDALTALLAEGLDINATTRTQPRTCLMEACKGNSDRAVDYLIAKRCCRAACGPSAPPVPAALLPCFAASACAGRAR